MKIQVTRRDITMGEQRSPSRCPVSRAVRRATKSDFVITDGWEITVGPKHFDAPKSVYNFVNLYDAGQLSTLKPFSFTLPYEVKRKTRRKVTTKKTSQNISIKVTSNNYSQAVLV